MATITGTEIQGMVAHWLNTPLNGYLGSDYGQDPKSMLQNPMSAGRGDDYIRKCRRDVSVVDALPQSQVGLYSVPIGFDQVQIVLAVADTAFEVNP